MSELERPKLVRQSACTYDDILEHLYNRLNEQQTKKALSKKTNKSDRKTKGYAKVLAV